MKYKSFKGMIGQTFDKVFKCGSDELHFVNRDGTHRFLHWQDCCEKVYIEEIWGDLSDLEGTPILEASKRTSGDEGAYELGQWTFYEFRTIKGSVTVRWYGSSNGFYSVKVSHEFVPAIEAVEEDPDAEPDNYEYRRLRDSDFSFTQQTN